MEIGCYEDIILGIHERIEAGGFADPDIRLLADAVRYIAIRLRQQEEWQMEQLERQ
jgi:hypothetical protein